MTDTYTIAQAEAIGGRIWAAGLRTRVYFGERVIATVLSLDVTRYASGNISAATLAGEKISNTRAAAILRARVWLEEGAVRTDPGRDASLIIESFGRALAASGAATR